MARQVEFFFDLLSPYAYLACCRLPGLVRRTGAELLMRPVSLPRILERTGNTPPSSVPARYAYVQQDVRALAAYYGLPLAWPPQFPVRTGRALSALTVLEGEARLTAAQRLFAALWVEGQDLGDVAVLEGLIGPELRARAADPAVRARLEAANDEAVARGAFGVPTLFVDGRMFFGNDRLFLVERALNADL